MPKWGLSNEQRDLKPWGLDAKWLAPDKTITDPVHGDVFLTRLEKDIIDSPGFQRLRRVRQLGNTHMIYPGATHSRFSHALGALRVVQDMLDVVLHHSGVREAEKDIFVQWKEEEDDGRRVTEAIVLARLCALLHDITHVPFGHTIEDELELLVPHDKNGSRLKSYWSGFSKDVRQALKGKGDSGRTLESEIKGIVLNKRFKRDHTAPYSFVHDLVGNTICADLLDYLRRDHFFCGLPLELGRRFMEGAYVRRSDEKFHPGRYTIKLFRGGRFRPDVMTELQKYLRYRYELAERALFHHGKLAADAMVIKLFETWQEWQIRRLALRVAKGAKAVKSAQRGELSEAARVKFGKQARAALEQLCKRAGDDALLEMLREQARNADPKSALSIAVTQLADDLLTRRFFKSVARYTQSIDRATDIYEKFGKSHDRQALEREVAAFAGLSPRDIAIWLPRPDMKLKVAEVLVQYQGGVTELSKLGNDPCREVMDAHKKLWGVSLFVRRSLKETQKAEQLKARLADVLKIQWDNGVSEAGSSVLTLVAHDAAESMNPPQPVTAALLDKLGKLAAFSKRKKVAPTYKTLLTQVKRALSTVGAKKLAANDGQVGPGKKQGPHPKKAGKSQPKVK